jgi:phosphotransferase system HPr (HPr) family protein
MEKIVTSIRQDDWDDCRIVRLVNRANKMKSDIEITSDNIRANVKSITSMMDFYNQMPHNSEVRIYFTGDDEVEAANKMKDYIEGNIYKGEKDGSKEIIQA